MSQPIRLALLGDPVEHSRSPAIHQAALRQAGLVGEYRAIRADRRILERHVEDLREGTLNGINVTMPLKAAAADLADELTKLARKAGSVNTLRAREGRVEAHSTDAIAFSQILQESRFEGGSSLLVLGSGGSARAALTAVGQRAVYVSARDPVKAEALVDQFEASGVVPWGAAVAGAIVVNATPLGMEGQGLPPGLLEAAAGLIDLPYGARHTPSVEWATTAGIPCVDGIEFLARQAAASFEWWTGVPLDSNALTEVARNV